MVNHMARGNTFKMEPAMKDTSTRVGLMVRELTPGRMVPFILETLTKGLARVMAASLGRPEPDMMEISKKLRRMVMELSHISMESSLLEDFLVVRWFVDTFIYLVEFPIHVIFLKQIPLKYWVLEL